MLKTILTIFVLVGTNYAVAAETITIFQFNGSLQCQKGVVVSPDQAAQKLKEAGINVKSKATKKIPYGIPKKCGAPTGEANVFEIDASEWAKFLKKQPGALGYGNWIFDRSTVEVYKYDGTLQCNQGKEIPLESMAEELTAKNIKVQASRKGKDGLVHIMVCGASTGNLNVYSIDADSLAAAKELGFKGLITKKMSDEISISSGARRGLPQPRTSPRGITPQDTQVPRLW